MGEEFEFFVRADVTLIPKSVGDLLRFRVEEDDKIEDEESVVFEAK